MCHLIKWLCGAPNRAKRVSDEPCKMIIKRNRSVIVNTIAGHVNYNERAVFITMPLLEGFH